ncbi:MAG: transglycosylase domain-containing protein [Elusimicrobiales bacterium]|nr:transglycosylase domain-containing protein [Elusimicrobiales bacterium]
MLSKHYKHHDHLLDTCRRQRNSPFKTFICSLAVIVGLAALLLAGYCASVVLKARRATPAIIQAALAPEKITLTPADLPRRRVDQLLKVEDPAFLDHNGVDLKTPGAGLTTITQALVKIFYFKEFKPGFAKLKQTLIARFVMTPLVSKQDQLTLFLNYAYLGNCRGTEVRGFTAAAQCYYYKKVERLKEDEYLSLVAMLIAPDTFSPVANPQANKDRVARIKKLIAGEYVPAGALDVYYGPLDPNTQTALAPASYFRSIYEN